MGPRSKAIHDKTFQIHLLDDAGGIQETLCEADHFRVIHAAFESAITAYSHSVLQLRNGARIVETVKTGRYDSGLDAIEVLERIK